MSCIKSAADKSHEIKLNIMQIKVKLLLFELKKCRAKIQCSSSCFCSICVAIARAEDRWRENFYE